MNRPEKTGDSDTAWLQKGEERKYPYNLPWTGVWLGAVIVALFAFGVGRLARNQTGLAYVGLMILSSLFIFLALMVLARRVFFPRVLRLDEDAIYFPRGFSANRADSIRYADIVRMIESNRQRLSLRLMTSRRQFSIDGPSLGIPENYVAVRALILQKASISSSSASEEVPKPGTWRETPEPALQWTEPDNWPRYRTHLVTSKPRLLRLGRTFWFFIRCLGIVAVPWIILRLCGLADSLSSYLPLALIVSLFFTWLHWYGVVHPASRKVLTFRTHGITLHYGKQFADYRYQDVSGWTIAERSFEGRSLDILLLEIRNRQVPCVFPDAETRDRAAKILGDKRVPVNAELKPNWENQAGCFVS